MPALLKICRLMLATLALVGLAMFGVFFYRSANRKTLEVLTQFLPVPVEGLATGVTVRENITYEPVKVLDNIQVEEHVATARRYFGAGVAPPDASWGTLLQDATARPLETWWLLLFPSAAIAATARGASATAVTARAKSRVFLYFLKRVAVSLFTAPSSCLTFWQILSAI